jgi:hypothetical protein
MHTEKSITPSIRPSTPSSKKQPPLVKKWILLACQNIYCLFVTCHIWSNSYYMLLSRWIHAHRYYEQSCIATHIHRMHHSTLKEIPSCWSYSMSLRKPLFNIYIELVYFIVTYVWLIYVLFTNIARMIHNRKYFIFMYSS